MTGRIRHLSIASTAMLAIMATSPVLAGPPRARTLQMDDKGQWIERPAPAPGTPAGDIHTIQQQLRDKNPRKALSAVKAFIKKYGQSHPQYPQVMITHAEALIGLHKFDKAHELLQQFLNQYTGSQLTDEALRLEFIIAEAYLSGTKRKLFGLRLLSGTDTAEQILDTIAIDYPQSRYAQYAVKVKAEYLFRKGEFLLAEMEYSQLIKDFPNGQYHELATKRSAEAALAGFRGIEYDDAALIEARERFRDFQARYPLQAQRDHVDGILDGIELKRAEKEYNIGTYYERTNHIASAIFYYRSVIAHWPDTLAAQKAKARLDLYDAGPDNPQTRATTNRPK